MLELARYTGFLDADVDTHVAHAVQRCVRNLKLKAQGCQLPSDMNRTNVPIGMSGLTASKFLNHKQLQGSNPS